MLLICCVSFRKYHRESFRSALVVHGYWTPNETLSTHLDRVGGRSKLICEWFFHMGRPQNSIIRWLRLWLAFPTCKLYSSIFSNLISVAVGVVTGFPTNITPWILKSIIVWRDSVNNTLNKLFIVYRLIHGLMRLPSTSRESALEQIPKITMSERESGRLCVKRLICKTIICRWF